MPQYPLKGDGTLYNTAEPAEVRIQCNSDGSGNFTGVPDPFPACTGT